ncbi:MAG: site-specific DNA-methyltransferase [Chloroflexi bacterium]|nr:site-specific DNA-methyltransferase [Chloroflexota bacterium]
MSKSNTGASTRVEVVKHKDKRVNIPTEELRDFVADDEKAPKTVLYPRDPSLDPQLVWKGKDEQDQKPLEVPAVPIYIQEKIHPQAIIEQVRAEAKKGEPQQMALFSDFNGIAFEDMVDFYRHEQKWSNRMILGDSLLVMTSLAEKEGLKGKVQMIYLDPPYGIKFGSNWQVSTRKRDVKDGKSEDFTRQPEQVRAFRDTWQLGVHSYLGYLRDRLMAARELLTETGSVFVQIGDENVHVVRCVLDEVFGSQNSISIITFATTSGFETKELARGGDFILWYGKNRESGVKAKRLFEALRKESGDGGYRWIMLPGGDFRGLTTNELNGREQLPSGARLYKPDNILSQGAASGNQMFNHFGKDYAPGLNSHWKAHFPDGMQRLASANRLHVARNTLQYVRYSDDFSWKSRNSMWIDTLTGQFTEDKVYVVQTNAKVVERCLLMTTDPGDLVLDPTCGSGTTAYVAEQWGRRWITVDTSRVALALARTRLMSAKYPYFLLADSMEGIKKESEIGRRSPSMAPPQTENDVRKGFVYRRVPHITLKSIANNEKIDVIHAKWNEELEPVRAELNSVLRQSWEEWQVPRAASDDWPDRARQLLEEWWALRRERQKEIDDSIAHRADVELLYDQPYEDSRRVRVTGPFTVESLSPHRVLSADEERPASEQEAQRAATVGQFEVMILENLKRAGIQNTRKNERLKLDRLEPYAGEWLHAAGEYTETGNSKRVAVCIGPEHGTVGPDLVKEAAKEALKGLGFDLLVVCGFAFDAHAGETAKEFLPVDQAEQTGIVAESTKQYGKLMILLARMNPDLAMGDELLKKTGAGNLFMVFGEPDVDVRHQDGKVVLEIKGVDVYDPTTGQIRSSSTDDIACWFIDTNYNGESFFVRHAYFTGADEPYEKLKRALRAEIDEEAWGSLYSTKSRAFDPPETGKIAVKVINHYGDEVLKVFEV